MTQEFRDRFDRVDGLIGPNYLIACGNATIFDEAVLPVTEGVGNSGMSPQLAGTTEARTQVLYNAEALDSKDQVIRCVWSHDAEILGERPLDELVNLTTQDPRFTLLARMTKDPMLVDLGRAQEPDCYDQGYGLRVLCPRDGSLPTLAIVKFTPPATPPGISRPPTAEPDGAIVLASVLLSSGNLIVDPDWDGTGNAPYRGFVQETRLRIRRADNEAVLEVFHNDRNMNTPILEYTDQEDPIWGVVGLPGFEFFSPPLTMQAQGASPFLLEALPIMRCHLFEVQSIKDFHRPASVVPSNLWTYDRCIDRVILLVERNGDAKYTATGAGTRRDTYLQFLVEAESHIIREVGYYEWLRRSQKVYMKDEQDLYEMPADVGIINFIRPSWNNVPLQESRDILFHNRLAGITRTGGRPQVYRMEEQSVNNRPRIRVFPVPTIDSGGTGTAQGTGGVPGNQNSEMQEEDDHLIIEYFGRQIFPSEPDVQLPTLPQEHIDVLNYGAAAHALLIDQDDANAQRFAQTFASKLQGLKRDAHRKVSGRQSVMRSAADVFKPNIRSRIPILRATQLETLLIF